MEKGACIGAPPAGDFCRCVGRDRYLPSDLAVWRLVYDVKRLIFQLKRLDITLNRQVAGGKTEEK